jgi:zinc protease
MSKKYKFAFKPVHILFAKYILIYVCTWYLFVLMNAATSLHSALAQTDKTKPTELNLPNGLKVIIWEDHSFPIVSTMMWYKVGAKNEKSGTTGINHLVEHLLFQNVGTFQKGNIGTAITRLGGRFNGYTSDDFTVFFETLPSQKLELALLIEAERMRSAKFNQADLKEEIENIEGEFESDLKNPLHNLAKEVRTTLFQQHPYRRPVRGWRSDIENLSLHDVKRFYDTYFWPNNATLVIVGDIESNNALGLINKYFAGIAKSPAPIPAMNIIEPVQNGEKRIVVKYPGKQEMLSVAYHAPSVNDNDAPAMVVIEKLLNATYAGKLKTKLINNRICANAYAGFEIKKDPGVFKIDCIAIPATYNAEQKIIQNLDGVINSLKTQLVSDGELKRAKKQSQSAFLLDQEGPYKVAFYLGYFEALSKWQLSQTWSERLNSVSAADVQRVAKKYFNQDNRVIGWLQGTSAQRPQPPSDAPKERNNSSPNNNHSPNNKQFEHTNLTGYKESDDAIGSTSTDIVKTADNNVVTNTISPLLPSKVSKRVLKNGLTIFVFESHMMPIVQIGGSVKAGDVYEPINKHGLSILTASIFNQGKSGRLQTCIGQEDIGLAPANMLTFANDLETINFRSSCLTNDLPQMLQLISQSLTNSSWTEDIVEKVKKETLLAIKHKEENISEKINRALLQACVSQKSPFYPGDPTDRLRMIDTISCSDIQSFISNNVQPNATTIVFAGDIDPIQAFTLAEKSFGNWVNKNAGKKPELALSGRRVKKIVIPISLRDKPKGTICYGKLLPISKNQDSYSNFLIADNVLSNHPIIARVTAADSEDDDSIALLKEQNVEVKLQPLANYTAWMISSDADLHALPLRADTLEVALSKLGKSGITNEEFVEAKRYLLGAIPVRKMSSLSSVTQNILEFVMHCNDAFHYNTFLSDLQNASLDSVNALIKSVFKPEESTQVIVGNSQMIKALHDRGNRKTQ